MYKRSHLLKKLIAIVVIFALGFIDCSITKASTITIEPEENQYLELKATTITDVEGQNKQVIMELWGHDINFKGFEVRFQYDNTKLKLSNLSTNEITEDETQYFKFEDEFSGSLELFSLPYDDTGNVLDWVVSFYPPVDESEHIIDKGDGTKIVTTSGGVLLGKVSFQLLDDEFDMSGFSLYEDTEYSPQTGIKINIDATQAYENQSTFRFTDATASKDAYLANILLSTGVVDDIDPSNSTYKEYGYSPVFDMKTFDYSLDLLEYLETINVKAVLNDEKATMKIKVPKRDADNNLVYDSDGTTIIYEEKDIQTGIPIELTLNKLGEPNTVFKIVVTAEDKKTTNEYTMVIKRPYAVIKGKNILADFDDEDVKQNIFDIYGVEVNNQATINLYNANLVEWESIPDIYGMTYEDPMTYEKLADIPKVMEYKSNNDGEFEIYVVPGTYDIQVTRLAYLDYIYSDVVVADGAIIDMGEFRMAAGDANRDGVISQEDVNQTKKSMDIDITSEDYSEACNPSQLGVIVAEDLAYVKKNQDAELQIVYFSS